MLFSCCSDIIPLVPDFVVDTNKTYCWIRSVANGGIVITIVTFGKLRWPGLEFTIFITINLEDCLSQVAGVRPAIYPTYRIAMPSYIASALPP